MTHNAIVLQQAELEIARAEEANYKKQWTNSVSELDKAREKCDHYHKLWLDAQTRLTKILSRVSE